MGDTCVFCKRLESRDLIGENEHAVAFLDAYPVSPGHTLIIPRRHQADFFSLAEHEQSAVWRLAAAVRGALPMPAPPDGYNVGINIGTAAGQTIDHAHLHLIPRYRGDTDDPRGGVRWIMPARAAYWRKDA